MSPSLSLEAAENQYTVAANPAKISSAQSPVAILTHQLPAPIPQIRTIPRVIPNRRSRVPVQIASAIRLPRDPHPHRAPDPSVNDGKEQRVSLPILNKRKV
jgi:hypothetical protein